MSGVKLSVTVVTSVLLYSLEYETNAQESFLSTNLLKEGSQTPPPYPPRVHEGHMSRTKCRVALLSALLSGLLSAQTTGSPRTDTGNTPSRPESDAARVLRVGTEEPHARINTFATVAHVKAYDPEVVSWFSTSSNPPSHW